MDIQIAPPQPRHESRPMVTPSRNDSGSVLQHFASAALWSMPVHGRAMDVSRGVETLTGYTRAELRTMTGNIWVERAHPEDHARVSRACGGQLMAGTPVEIEFRFQRKDGTWLWLRSRTSARFDREGTMIDGFVTDVTEHRRLEDEVTQLQKMEMVGQMAGGIAHDFRNLLTVILGGGQLLLETTEDAESRREIDAILDAGARAAALTSQLLGFSRRAAAAPAALNLSDVVRNMRPLLERAIGEDVQFAASLGEALWSVRADRMQIEQIIANLVINARDAMPEGGALVVATRNVELPDAAETPAERTAAPGGYCQLTVSDTGCGMDAGTLARAFEPYFTTKPTGHGTGLGLSTCGRIAASCGGFIDVRTRPGQGTAISVYLPRLDVTAAPADSAPDAVDPTGTETILVVEDDRRVLMLVSRMLEPLGYQVLAASNAQEAFELFAEHGARVDLIVSDVILPDVNGPEIVRRLLHEAPDVKVLFMSGHTSHALLRDGRLQASPNFIQKPFERASLHGKIREVLGA